jgi:hypothetical protein
MRPRGIFENQTHCARYHIDLPGPIVQPYPIPALNIAHAQTAPRPFGANSQNPSEGDKRTSHESLFD